ncbi:ABC transporter ATP-binding protein [Desulfovibrio aminophilus]|nr:ABC transporter ATP-binding protein [Desulfovibrio aminophilus]MCM0756032.1 ABC transporter ATP-binding protein [Desulfovibrio aminophilus]
MLTVRHLDVFRGRTHVLRDVDLEVGRGEIVALIGANGAGKTTTLRTISGLLPARNGEISFAPRAGGEVLDLTRAPAEAIVAAGVCHCPEGRGVFARLSVHENLLMGAYLRDDGADIRRDMEQVCEMFPILAARRNQAAGNLSGGEQMMLAIGRALMGRPRLLILDEPSLGLAPLVVEAIFQLLARINREGVTILLVEQNAVVALELAHRAYVLENGRVVMSGESAALAGDDNIRKAYLGG